MGGKSPVAASEEQRAALMALAGSRDRGEADRARAVLLTLSGWTSARIGEAFGVREDTVRLWRSDFGKGDVAALEASIAPGPPPVKSETALARGHAVARPAGGRPNELDPTALVIEPIDAGRGANACDVGSDREHRGSPWQAEILVTPNLMIWSAAIYCTQVVQDIVVVG